MTSAASSKPAVLIVDDSTAQLDVLTPAFEAAGFEVGHAVDGEEVFRRLSALDPVAVLLDVYLPGIDGAEVCRLMKSHPAWQKSYLLVMSARLTDEDEATFKRLGAEAILRKPFEPEVALAQVLQGLAARGS
jgi:twitching motility two-component system response regulator PilG/twitching motility two-component system response regulator PilH